ncbi:MAG: SAM-dependent methyltransferase [Planctomycetota bacterium]|nr:MAG: SAM-dependent methyltransferase [Planctomycetota bacterium]
MLANSDYQILDSGDGKKLEAFGDYIVTRPAAQALWPRSLSVAEWDKSSAEFFRNEGGNGEWKISQELPEEWKINICDITFIVKPTSFGHMGVFPEAYHNWVWLADHLKNQKSKNILSLFSYTGGYTLVPALYDAKVCHVDASKTVVKWARRNAEASGLQDKPVRWIVEDVRKFIQREIRRGSKYDGIVMDPPTYGRGNNGELWKIDEHLIELINDCAKVLTKDASFFMVNTYAGDITATVLKNILLSTLPQENAKIECGEMLISQKDSAHSFPNGMTAVWSRG